MIGGPLKSVSRVALAAAAGVLSGVAAQAADFGGDCCADLEERVAELEGTAARKGNSKVSLTIGGQVNEALLFWDDGVEKNLYVVTNENSRTRFRFVGDAKITADWSAGYLLEIGAHIANSETVNQLVDDDTPETASLSLRHSAWYLDSKTLGRILVGHTGSSTDGITEINLSNAGIIGNSEVTNWNGGFFLRRDDGELLAGFNNNSNNGALVTGLTWSNILSQANSNVGEGDRRNVVKYVSPNTFGFILQAAAGEDDFWDVALRYAGELGAFRIAAGVGYQRWTDGNATARFPDNLGDFHPVSTGSQGDRGCADLDFVGHNGSDVDCHAVGLSGSIMHLGTGLYVHGSYGYLQDDNREALFAANLLPDADDRDEHWYIQGGIEQRLFAPGKTTMYGEFFRANTGAGLDDGDARDLNGLSSFGSQTFISSSDVDVWGFGVVQSIDAAAMDLYIGYRNYAADVTTATVPPDNESTDVERKKLEVHDFQAIMAGGLIRF
jgi:hypothetical protein